MTSASQSLGLQVCRGGRLSPCFRARPASRAAPGAARAGRPARGRGFGDPTQPAGTERRWHGWTGEEALRRPAAVPCVSLSLGLAFPTQLPWVPLGRPGRPCEWHGGVGGGPSLLGSRSSVVPRESYSGGHGPAAGWHGWPARATPAGPRPLVGPGRPVPMFSPSRVPRAGGRRPAGPCPGGTVGRRGRPRPSPAFWRVPEPRGRPGVPECPLSAGAGDLLGPGGRVECRGGRVWSGGPSPSPGAAFLVAPDRRLPPAG